VKRASLDCIFDRDAADTAATTTGKFAAEDNRG